jgi:hypothetical protein
LSRRSLLFVRISAILQLCHLVLIQVVATFIRFCKYVLYFLTTLVFVVRSRSSRRGITGSSQVDNSLQRREQ